MLRRIVIVPILVIAGLSTAGSASARRWHPLDATPFAHAPCSVLSGRPCTPSYCSVFNHGPCIPEIDYPYGENLQLTVETVPSHDDAAKYQNPGHDLDTIGDLFAELRFLLLESLEILASASIQPVAHRSSALRRWSSR